MLAVGDCAAKFDCRITRTEALQHAAENIERAVEGLGCHDSPLRVLIENTAGSEFSMGGTLEQVADLLHLLDRCVPVDVCLDTCHINVSGYDLVSSQGYEQTLGEIAQSFGTERVLVWHCMTPKRRWAANWTGTSTLAREPSARRPFAVC